MMTILNSDVIAKLHDLVNTLAPSEGWGLFELDSTGFQEIQKDDEANVFTSDVQAVNFVAHRAQTSLLHRLALALHEHCAKNETRPS